MKKERFEYFMKHIIGESRYADMSIIDIIGAAYEFGRLDEANGYDKDARDRLKEFEERLAKSIAHEAMPIKPNKILMQEKEWERIRTGALPERCRTCVYGDEYCHPKCNDCENGSNKVVTGHVVRENVSEEETLKIVKGEIK